MGKMGCVIWEIWAKRGDEEDERSDDPGVP